MRRSMYDFIKFLYFLQFFFISIGMCIVFINISVLMCVLLLVIVIYYALVVVCFAVCVISSTY